MAACVQAGANHIDISGEPQYLEKMQLKYHQVSSLVRVTLMVLTAQLDRKL